MPPQTQSTDAPHRPGFLERLHLTKGPVIAMLFFILLAPLASLATLALYKSYQAQNTLIGIGRLSVDATSAYMNIEVSSDNGGGTEAAVAAQEQVGQIRTALVSSGFSGEHISAGAGGYDAVTIVVHDIPAASFALANETRGKLAAEFPQATFTIHYTYSITPEDKLMLLSNGIADAQKQANAIAKSQSRSLVAFNGSLCNVYVIDADVMFNPSLCTDTVSSDSDTNPRKVLVGLVAVDSRYSVKW